MQTSSSSIQLSSPNCVCGCSYHYYRKSKSEEELRKYGEGKEFAEFNGVLNLHSSHENFFCETKKVFEDRDRFKFSTDVKNDPLPCIDCLNSKHPNLLNKLNHQAENTLIFVSDNLEATVNEWLKVVPIKNNDSTGEYVNRQQIARIISNKLLQIIFKTENKDALESHIVMLIKEIPIDANDSNKEAYISSLANKILEKSLEIFEFSTYKHRRNITDRNNNKHECSRNTYPLTLKYGIQPTEEEVRGFVREILFEFVRKSKCSIILQHLQNLEIELIDVLIDSLTELNASNHLTVKKELFIILYEIGLIPGHEAILLTDILFDRFKAFISNCVNRMKRYGYPQKFVVLQSSSSPHSATNTTDFSIESISQKDIDACLDFYINRLIQEINSWLSRVLGPDISFVREVAVNDLAGDIVDRLKYLDRNPEKEGSPREELEVMKFQIYKWINRLVGDNAIQQAIERAPELMQKIQSIPVPMLSRPGEHGYTLDSLPPCCVSQSTPKTNEFPTDTWHKKQNVRQSSNNNNLPETALTNAPGQSRSRARSPVLENRYTVPDTNTSEVDADNLNISQMPMFGPTAGGGSMIENSDKKIYTNKRFSLPGVVTSDRAQDVGINQLPMIKPIDQIARAVQFTNNRNLTNNTLNSPKSLASAPIFQNSGNTNVHRTPVYESSGQQLNMPGAGGTTLPGIYAPEEVMPEFGKYNVSELPMFGTAGRGGSMINAGHSNHRGKRISGPGAFDLETRARGHYQPTQRNFDRIAPTYPTSQQRLNTSEVRVPKSSNIRTADEVMQKFKKHNLNGMPIFGVAEYGGSMIDAGTSNKGVRRMSGPGAFDLETRTRGPYQPAPSNLRRPIIGPDTRQTIPSQLDQINRIHTQYDQFLKKWVTELPLPTNTPEEKTMANTIRLGFYKAVWKTLSKINLDPVKYSDRVYCQGIVEEKLQELFDLLPETQELRRRKGELKTVLLQKTMHVISITLSKLKASNYKQQLMDQVSNHIPNQVKSSADFQTDRHEELKKIQLVDTFILYTRYKEDDKVRANVYRKKLNECVEDILKNVKRSYKSSLVNIDEEVYKNEVFNALHRVPLPTADIISEEADEILLGIEIEKWFSDLPIIINSDPTEQLDRRRILYAFAKQIHDMGMYADLINDSSVEQLKIATKRFLQKLPFQPNQEANLNFMCEELINRLKNRAEENVAQRPKSVSFEVPNLFAVFANDVPLSSSVAEVNPFVVHEDNRSQYSNQGQSGQLQIVGGHEPSETQRWFTLLPVTSESLESRLLAPFTPLPSQEVHESQHLPHLSQQARANVVNPQQQILSENQIHGSNGFGPAPIPNTSSTRSVPVVQSVPTNEADIVVEGEGAVVSGLPSQQKSNRVILNELVAPVSQQVARTSIRSSSVSSKPLGVLGTSQIAGPSGRPPIRRTQNAPTVMPNITADQPNTRPHKVPQVVLSPHMAYPQPTHPEQVPASNIRIDIIPAPPSGNSYISDQVPVANSTPQQSHPPRREPPRLEKKRRRDGEKRCDGARRHLDFEDTGESESDEIECRCMERVYKCRRRRPYYDRDNYNMMECSRYFPIMYPHPYFF